MVTKQGPGKAKPVSGRPRIRRGRYGIAALLVLALGGCVVGPDYEPPQAELPQAWPAKPSGTASSIRIDAAAQTDWWTTFADPTLKSLIERAAAANPDVKIAAVRVLEARAQRAAIGTAGLPSVNASASWQGQRLSENTPTGRLFGTIGQIPGLDVSPASSNPYGQFQIGGDAVWEPDLFGRVRRGIEAADADVATAQEDRNGVILALYAEVARLYVDLRGAQLKRSVATQSLATARELLGLARKRRDLGLSNSIDVTRSEAQAELIEAQLPLFDRQIELDINELSRLLNLAPRALRSELTVSHPVPPVPAQITIGLPAELACRRPDIRSAEKRLHAAVARQGVATADLYPRITLFAAGGYQAQDATNLLDWASRFGVIGPQISLPIFDGGRRRRRVEIEAYRAQAARLGYAKTVLIALHEVDGALTSYSLEERRRAALAAAVEHGRNAVRLARLRYENGLDSVLDVLDAERSLHDNELVLADSTTAVSLRVVTLFKVLGGGWENMPDAIATCR